MHPLLAKNAAAAAAANLRAAVAAAAVVFAMRSTWGYYWSKESSCWSAPLVLLQLFVPPGLFIVERTTRRRHVPAFLFFRCFGSKSGSVCVGAVSDHRVRRRSVSCVPRRCRIKTHFVSRNVRGMLATIMWSESCRCRSIDFVVEFRPRRLLCGSDRPVHNH